MPEDAINPFPSSLGDIKKEEAEGTFISGRILTLIKILIRVPLSGASLLCQQGSAYLKVKHGHKKKASST